MPPRKRNGHHYTDFYIRDKRIQRKISGGVTNNAIDLKGVSQKRVTGEKSYMYTFSTIITSGNFLMARSHDRDYEGKDSHSNQTEAVFSFLSGVPEFGEEQESEWDRARKLDLPE